MNAPPRLQPGNGPAECARVAPTNRNDYHARITVLPRTGLPIGFPHALPRFLPGLPRSVAHAGSRPMITVALTSLGFCSLALAGSAFSALALYAASPHCRWPRLRRAGRLGRQISLVAAVAALWLWIANLGIATGVVVMLCSWMLAAVLLPLLAAWHRPAQVMR